jgi:hypothetical protein
MTVLLNERLLEQELIAKRKRIIAAMSKEEQMEMMNQATDRFCRRLNDEYTRQQTEIYKQSDRYKEYLKRRQAEQDSE